MTQTKIACHCGWVFFVAELPPTGISCPRCGEPVAPLADLKRAAAAPLPRGAWLLAIAGIATVAIAGWIAFGVLRKSGQADAAQPPKPGTVPDITAPVTGDPKRELELAVWRQNVVGLLSHLLKQRGEARAKELADRIADGDVEIDFLASKAGCPVPDHFRSADVVKKFAGSSEVDKAVSSALRKLAPGDAWEFEVLRGIDRVVIAASFREVPPELKSVVERYVALGEGAATSKVPNPPVEPTTEPTLPPTPKPEPLPTDVVKAVRERIVPMSGYYQSFLTPAEHERLKTLLRDGRGMPEDLEFLEQRVLGEVWRAVTDEIAFIRSQIVEFEGRAKAAGSAGSDVVVKKDGSKLDGRVISEDDEGVKLEVTRGSVKGIVVVPRAEVKEIQRGAGAGALFQAKLAEAKGKPEALAELSKWCRTNGLTVHGDWVCWMVLDLDPASELARLALGYAKNEAGQWTKERDVKGRGEMIDYDGRSYTLDEFKKVLRARGYVELNGSWHARKPWGLKIANLYRDEAKLPLALDNAVVTERSRLETERTVDAITKQPRETTRRVAVCKMIGPLGRMDEGVTKGPDTTFKDRRGSATIILDAPTPFIDCKIKAVAEVAMQGGAIRVWVTNESGGSKELCKLDSVKRFDSFVDVSEVARGFKRITVHVEMSGPWLAADNGPVMFLPSKANDLSVFDVTAQVADPLKAVNAAIASVVKPPEPTVEKSIEGAAEKAGDDAIEAMVRRMQEAARGAPSGAPGEPPEEFMMLFKYVTDAATFDPSKLTNAAQGEIREWWTKLAPGAKRKVALVFGRQCVKGK